MKGDAKVKTKSLFLCFSVIVLVMGYSSVVCAGTISGVLGGGIWDGWTQFQDNNVNFGKGEDWVGKGGKVFPGWGGQNFDAEYLFYNLEGNTLSLGLQTGFDIEDGKYRTGGKNYYAGDMALSFDGTTTYTHAIDFGLKTRDYGNHRVAAVGGYHHGNNSNDIDTAGLYSVSKWNTHVISGYGASNPFAMDGGSLADNGDGTNYNFTTIDFDSSATPNGDTSFYRQVSFDISDFRDPVTGDLDVDAHWTMSCGNDAINGSFHEPAPVPEPGTIALLGIGLAGLAGVGARRKWKKKAADKS